MSDGDVISVTLNEWPAAKILPMRTVMFSLNNPNDHNKPIGSLESGGGFYNDALVFRWGDEIRFVRGYDMFKAWVGQIDPEGAKALP